MILILDKNNQYGLAMTKSLPTGCIKTDTDTTWGIFNLLLECVGLEHKIGHLFIVDTEFNVQNATKK